MLRYALISPYHHSNQITGRPDGRLPDHAMVTLRIYPYRLIGGDGTGFSPRLPLDFVPRSLFRLKHRALGIERIIALLLSPRLTLARCPACSLIPLMAVVGAIPNRKRLGISPGCFVSPIQHHKRSSPKPENAGCKPESPCGAIDLLRRDAVRSKVQAWWKSSSREIAWQTCNNA